MEYTIPAIVAILTFFAFQKNKYRDDICLVLTCLTCFIMLALRDTTHGNFNDLPGYKTAYDAIKNFSFSIMTKNTHLIKCFAYDCGEYGQNMESGYVWANWLVSRFSGNFRTFLIVHAMFFSTTVYWFVKKYSKDLAFSIFLLICCGFMYRNTFIMRQSISVCILLYSISALEKKKYFRFCLLVFLAFTFHRSSISFIILLPLSFIKVTPVSTSILSTIAVLLMLVPKYVLPFARKMFVLFDRGGYSKVVDELPYFVFVYVAMIIYIILASNWDESFTRIDQLSTLCLIVGTAAHAFSFELTILERISMGTFLPFASLVIPNVSYNSDKKKLVKIVYPIICFGVFLMLIKDSADHSFFVIDLPGILGTVKSWLV